MKVLISTDSSCLIKEDTFKKCNISVFPLNVLIDGVEYLDGVSINQAQLADAMLDNKSIKTSTPPLGVVIEYFEKLFSLGYDRIIHFTISSKLSSMYELFLNVSKNHFANRICVIDSYSVSAVMLSEVLYAYDCLEKGGCIEDIYRYLEKRKKDSKIYFIPENLMALKNGGRISPTVAAIANKIGLKPVIMLKDGSLEKVGMTTNVVKVLIEKIKVLSKSFPVDDYDYTLIEFEGKTSIVEKITDKAKKVLEIDDIIHSILPINICAHCGPGTIGIIISPKINNKSILEYI